MVTLVYIVITLAILYGVFKWFTRKVYHLTIIMEWYMKIPPDTGMFHIPKHITTSREIVGETLFKKAIETIDKERIEHGRKTR